MYGASPLPAALVTDVRPITTAPPGNAIDGYRRQIPDVRLAAAADRWVLRRAGGDLFRSGSASSGGVAYDHGRDFCGVNHDHAGHDDRGGQGFHQWRAFSGDHLGADAPRPASPLAAD